MKKIIILTVLAVSSLFSKQYLTQIKANEKIEIKSQNEGVITFVNKDFETKFIKNKQIILEINSKDEKIELKREKESLIIQKQIVQIKEKNYKAKEKIKQISKYEKNNEKLSYLESKKLLIQNIQSIKKLQHQINKKVFNVEAMYVNTIFVKKGEYVNLADKLYTLYDISKLKLELFLSYDEIKNIKEKSIYVNGLKSDFKVHQINKIKDEIKVSRYKVVFLKDNTFNEKYFFNKIVKVELR